MNGWIPMIILLVPLLAACSSAAAGTDGGAGSPSAAAPAQPQTSISRPAARPGAATAQDADLVARGKVIFEQTAGGVGCQFCHGLDAKGKAEFASPDIRAKQFDDVTQAMATRPLMSGVKLSDAEVRAVVAYLGTLP
jgi:mono/diheme cytochrome c family protein